MKRSLTVLLVICVYFTNLLGLSVLAEEDNLLVNPGFEENMRGWIKNTYETAKAEWSLDVTNEKAHTGSYSFKLENKGSHRNVVMQNIDTETLVVDEEYTFSAYVLAESSTENGARLRVMRNDGTYGDIAVSKTHVTDTKDKWEKMEIKFKVSEEVKTIKLKLRWDGNGVVYFDDACLTGKRKPIGAPLPSNEIKETYAGFSEELQNGGFETSNSAGDGPAGWDVYKSVWKDNQFVRYSTEKAYSGKYAVKIEASSSGSPWVRQIVKDLEPGASYQVSAWINSSNIAGKGVIIKFEFYSGNEVAAGTGLGVDVMTEQLVKTNGRWIQIQHTFVAPEKAKCVAIYPRLMGTGTVYFDDISCRIIDKVPTHFLETNEVFYYSDLKTGTATVRTNKTSYPDINTGKVDFKLKDGEKVLEEKKDNILESGEVKYVFDLSLLAEKKKEYQIEAITKDKDGNVLSTRIQPIYKYDRPTMLDEKGNYIIDGEIFNPVFGYHVLEDQYPICKDAGINVVQTWLANNTPEKVLEKLDLIHKYNLKGIVTLYMGMKPAGHPNNVENTSKVIELIKDHPAVFAYAVQDEPFLAGTTTEEHLHDSYRLIRSIDSKHPVYMVDAYSNTFHITGKYTDILTIDPYPGGSNVPTEYVADETEIAMDMYGDRKPVYVIAQAFSYKGYTPNADELRNMIYQGFFEGGKSLGYYALDEKIDGKIITESIYWDVMTSWYQKEGEDTFNHFSHKKYPVFSEYEDEVVQWSSYIKDNEIYAVVLNKVKDKETKLSMPLVSTNGRESVNGFNASVYAGGDSSTLNGTDKLEATLRPAQAVVYKITPNASIDTSKLTLSSFTDLEEYAWAKTQIEDLEKKGIVNSLEKYQYRPDAKITRADFAMFLIRTLGLQSRTTENFADVDKDAYYAKELAIGKAVGILKGVGDGNFNPNAEISRQDLMVICARGMKVASKLNKTGDASNINSFSDKDQIANYAVEEIAAMVEEEIVKGNADGTINPLGNATRAEAAVIMYRILNK